MSVYCDVSLPTPTVLFRGRGAHDIRWTGEVLAAGYKGPRRFHSVANATETHWDTVHGYTIRIYRCLQYRLATISFPP
jgi:hypothetical protein